MIAVENGFMLPHLSHVPKIATGHNPAKTLNMCGAWACVSNTCCVNLTWTWIHMCWTYAVANDTEHTQKKFEKSVKYGSCHQAYCIQNGNSFWAIFIPFIFLCEYFLVSVVLYDSSIFLLEGPEVLKLESGSQWGPVKFSLSVREIMWSRMSCVVFETRCINKAALHCHLF